MWSLGVEVGFYAALPLIGWGLVRCARRRRVAGPLLVCAALTAGGLAWTLAGVRGHWATETMWTLPTYLPLFACGIAAAVLAHGRRPTRPAAAALLAAGAAVVLLNGYWHEEGTGFVGHVVADLPAGVGFAVIVAIVASRPAGVLSLAPFRALGALSYGVYLWHMPVMFALMLHHAFPPTAQAALPRVLGPTLLLAAASWWLVERPILRWAAAATRSPVPRRATTRPGAPVARLAD